MTAQLLETSPISAGDDWFTQLENMLDPAWRRGEWDPVTFVFVGDPSNARLALQASNTAENDGVAAVMGAGCVRVVAPGRPE